jgi:hypothetical protein
MSVFGDVDHSHAAVAQLVQNAVMGNRPPYHTQVCPFSAKPRWEDKLGAFLTCPPFRFERLVQQHFHVRLVGQALLLRHLLGGLEIG